MDKLSMMSILSSFAAEISGSSRPNLSASIQNSKTKVGGGGGGDDDANCKGKIGNSSSTAGSDHQQQQMQKQRFLRWLLPTTTTTPRCAPELDGLNCFETFVSH